MSNSALHGNSAFRDRYTVQNAEASASIPRGTPVAFTMNGTSDGLAVILPSSSAAKAHAFAFGVALGDIAAGRYGDVLIRGFAVKAAVLLQTRTASGESWSTGSIAQAVLLKIDTVNNVFASSGGTLAATAYLPFAVLGESTTWNASASATNDTRTALTGYMKALIRMM
jgi:hypothetical protein